MPLSADNIFHNANVITMDPSLPRCRALAIKDGRFLAVGSDADVLGLGRHRRQGA